MKDGFLKAAAAAPKIRVADPAWNALEICKALDSCYAQRAKLIVLPELCLTGYTCQDLFLQERLLEESLEGLQTVLERLTTLVARGTAPDLMICNYVYEHVEDGTSHTVRTDGASRRWRVPCPAPSR